MLEAGGQAPEFSLQADATTFVLDQEGRVARVFERVKPERHAAQVLAALGEVAG